MQKPDLPDLDRPPAGCETRRDLTVDEWCARLPVFILCAGITFAVLHSLLGGVGVGIAVLMVAAAFGAVLYPRMPTIVRGPAAVIFFAATVLFVAFS